MITIKDSIFQFVIDANEKLIDVMKKIEGNSRKILFVVDGMERLVGAVTDGDIRRWIIQTGNLESIAEQFMNSHPLTAKRNDVVNAKQYMEKNSITALPVIDENIHILDIIFLDESEIPLHSKKLEDAPLVIMAGGKGTRLYPYTKILPKPLIPIGDIPIMERIIKRFNNYGVERFWATVNYKREMIKSYFADNALSYNIEYVDENKPLGTAGSLRLICENFDKPFFVTNCDILIEADYVDLYDYHLNSGNELTVVTALKNIEIPYGVVHASGNGTIDYLEEKPRLSYFVNTGMYILNPRLKDEIPQDTFFHMTDLIEKLLKEERKVGMYPVGEDAFLDMGEFEEMHRMEEKLKNRSE